MIMGIGSPMEMGIRLRSGNGKKWEYM